MIQKQRYDDLFQIIDKILDLREHKDFDPGLIWFEEFKLGWYPVNWKNCSAVYDEKYFTKYVGYRETNIGVMINDLRCQFVQSILDDPKKSLILDYGFGAGHFISMMKEKYDIVVDGYDVNPYSFKWLLENAKSSEFWDLKKSYDCITFWDSFEHIHDIREILKSIKNNGYAIMTIPIFKNALSTVNSKHFRKDEHYWYFQYTGLIDFMKSQQFSYCGANYDECSYGRNGVITIAFKKVKS